MKYKEEWKTSGIYVIKCISNSKLYIGKSVNMYQRLKAHTTLLNTRSSNENLHLIRAWHKYGQENFTYDILEYCNINLLSKKELYYIKLYDTIKLGFNMRLDTESGMIPSKETRRKLSESMKKRMQCPKEIEKLKIQGSLMWRNKSKVEIETTKDRLSKSRTRYDWYQYDKNNNLIRRWNSVRDILKENPNYKRHNIYAAASGEKPSIYGYMWKKILK